MNEKTINSLNQDIDNIFGRKNKNENKKNKL